MKQLDLNTGTHRPRTRAEIIAAVRTLCALHKQGALGGARMPEDANPGLEKNSRDNFHYFTLPMALNYQRNSYRLWESALETFADPDTRFVFAPEAVALSGRSALCAALTKHGLALQPNRHTAIWETICETLVGHYSGDVRTLFESNNNDIALIREEVQITQKKGFPYLSGVKIANYWLYVMTRYTGADLRNRQCLSVAPDTHVIQASVMLGVVEDNADENALRPRVAEAWTAILAGTDLCPIDVHTPLWLWSRRRFNPGL